MVKISDSYDTSVLLNRKNIQSFYKVKVKLPKKTLRILVREEMMKLILCSCPCTYEVTNNKVHSIGKLIN